MRLWMTFASTGCIATGPGSAVPMSLALGTQATVEPNALCETCLNNMDQIRDVVVEVPGVVEVVDIGPATITLAGNAPGTTLVAISGLDGGATFVERYLEVTVRPAVHFELSPRCDPSEPSENPYLVPLGSKFDAYWFMYSSEYTPLVGDPRLDFGEILAQAVDLDNESVQLLAPDKPGTFEATSPIWNGPLAVFDVFDPDSAYDGLAFEPIFSGPVTLEPDGGATLVRSAMLVGGKKVCLDDVPRTVEALTPDVCGVEGRGQVNAETTGTLLTIFGHAPGWCTVRVTSTEFGFTDLYEVEFVRP